MADLSVTVANVGAGSSAVVDNGRLAGATITAGQFVYLDSSSTWQLMQCDGTAAEAGSGGTFGMALHGALAGQPLAVQTGGIADPGATVTVAKVYVVSETAGNACPIADITTSTRRLTILGFGDSATTIDMSIKKYTGVTIP